MASDADGADAVAFSRHDHRGCVEAAMAHADARSRAEGLRLTPVRRRVLEILMREHVALGAYDVLARLRAEGLGSLPPVAYRALDFLVTHGFAHRIERRNAFVACAHPGTEHEPAFLICSGCETVAEARAPAIGTAFGTAARASGFAIGRTVLEAEGLCPACRDGAPA